VRSNAELAEELYRKCTIMTWMGRLGERYQLHCVPGYSTLTMCLGMASREERLALLECMAKRDWYDRIGHLIEDIEIPKYLRVWVRGLVQRAILEALVPVHEIKDWLEWMAPRIEFEEGAVPWHELAEALDVELRVLIQIVQMYCRQRKLKGLQVPVDEPVF